MERWQRVVAAIGGVAVVFGLAVFAVFGDATRATAVGTLLTASVAAASLAVVVQLDRQLVAIERARRSDEVLPRVTASFVVWRSEDTELGDRLIAGKARNYLVVENRGAGAARQVRVEVSAVTEAGVESVPLDQLDEDELPLELLDAGGAYPIPLGRDRGSLPSPRRYFVRLDWLDLEGRDHVRELALRRA